MTGACYVGMIRVRDDACWQESVARVGGTVSVYGGTILFRGMHEQIMAGEKFTGVMPMERVVMLQFSDAASARRWHDSAEYQQLIPLRDRAADVTLILYAA